MIEALVVAGFGAIVIGALLLGTLRGEVRLNTAGLGAGRNTGCMTTP